MTEADRVCAALTGSRIDMSVEMVTQEQIAGVLRLNGITFQKEFKLGPGSRIDFLCKDGTGIEVKLAGQSKAIYRQVLKYTMSDEVEAVIIASSKSLGFPSEVNGKPCRVVSLSRAWM